MAGVRIYHSLEEAGGGFGPSAISIGNFDGVHVGHRRIFERVVAAAREHGWTPSALTFHPHPARVVAPERAPRLLTTPAERAELMGAAGIEQVFILPFDRVFSEQSPEEFVERVLVRGVGARAVLVGENFRFGRGQAGDTAALRRLGEKYGFLTEVIPPVRVRSRLVSSSTVRRLIESGGVSLAGRLLGRPYALEGAVVAGRGVGRRRTVPTLNLATGAEVLPAVGVYVTRTLDLDSGRLWPSVTNVGHRPTFGGGAVTVETFLLNGPESCPPARIRVEFLRRLREERTFPSAENLKVQIVADAGRARRYHALWQRWVRQRGAGRLIYWNGERNQLR